MKLKNIYKVIGAGALVLLMAGCKDGNDWDTDGSYNRTFAPTGDITVERFDTKVAVSFKAVAGVKSYEVELSTDSLYLDEVSSSSIVNTFKARLLL